MANKIMPLSRLCAEVVREAKFKDSLKRFGLTVGRLSNGTPN